jgi:hypothetical protein
MPLNKETLRPILEPVLAKLEKRFPKERRDELKTRVLTNLKDTRSEVESRARALAEKSKDNALVLNYLRPLVGSEKTTEVLTKVETKVSSAAPVVRKLRSLRQQFMEFTAPQSNEKAHDDEAPAPSVPKKRKSKSSKSSEE